MACARCCLSAWRAHVCSGAFACTGYEAGSSMRFVCKLHGGSVYSAGSACSLVGRCKLLDGLWLPCRGDRLCSMLIGFASCCVGLPAALMFAVCEVSARQDGGGQQLQYSMKHADSCACFALLMKLPASSTLYVRAVRWTPQSKGCMAGVQSLSFCAVLAMAKCV
jgi:hypothetical protein